MTTKAESQTAPLESRIADSVERMIDLSLGVAIGHYRELERRKTDLVAEKEHLIRLLRMRVNE